ncbi:sugar transferase [Shimia marina]|uniref:UDP-glucose:undecaprenyl-phosphate glucose-1-phosphate transferase n=1 Tax=Shimia marina TaxID=321267 RepID=A0A0P1EMA2_9RHOB|nr:sugar transferase [Shimia marina]CUH51483.1 UDP-glucose:undecaprenyl-phosphate glucose-1-phosphate transferase [Shimia marina]SFD47960.1 Sugar transferase involved in LPS biosynthesis (colanic, teichoic acid) [Shimia marina]
MIRQDTTFGRRMMDLGWVLLLLVVLWPLMLVIAALILIRDGWPIFYVSERMRSPTQGFMLLKFRSMSNVDSDSGVSGGDKAHRITKTGYFMRRYRLDELPQLFNILKGDISFVGPRPPLRRYVERFPALYGEVLKERPGVTGLATLIYHRTEERLLADCATPAETEAVYERRCVPRKARLDLIYARRRTLCSDQRLTVATVFRRLPPVYRKRGHR